MQVLNEKSAAPRKTPWRIAILGEDENHSEASRLLMALGQSGNIRGRVEGWDLDRPHTLHADAALIPATSEPAAAIRNMRVLAERQPELPVIGIFALYDARHAVEAGVATRGRLRVIFWDGTPHERLVGEVLSVLEAIKDAKAPHSGVGIRPLLLEALSLSPIALCLTTQEDAVVEVNDAFSDLFGQPPEELMGRKLADIVPRRRDDSLAVVLEELDPTRTVIGHARLKVWSAAAPRFAGLAATAALRDGTLSPADLTTLQPDDLVLLARDPVTGLANRQAFLQQLEQRVREVRPGEEFALLCLDLDRFKEVNDSLGHPVGDQVLKVIGDRLRRRVRALDMVARLAGDEFAILVHSVSDIEDIKTLAHRLIHAVGQRVIVGPHEIQVGGSTGTALYPRDADDATGLLRRADLALCEAKRKGGRTQYAFDPVLEERVRARRHMEGELYRGIERGEFLLEYQPVLELPSRRVIGVEALARWNHPERGLIGPSEFIPLAEATGSIRMLGSWVLHQACRAVASWKTMRLPRLWLAVNISATQFRSGDLVDMVDFALSDSGLPASELELEITETAVMDARRLDTTHQLTQLNELGVTISVDDFGTGYGSLIYLRNFPITKIKIDGSFVTAAPHRFKEAAIVRAICGLGRDLHMRVLAEGVETEQQCATVEQAGCTEAQGFLFSKSLDEQAIVRLLSSSPGAEEPSASDWVFARRSPHG